MVTNGQKFVQGQNNAGLRQGAADMQEKFDAEIGKMMKMNNVRLQFLQQRYECARQFGIPSGVLEMAVSV